MKRVFYYITDHGLGHATRSVAMIRELQKQNVEVIIRNSKLIRFLEKSLPGTKIISGITDTGPIIQKNGISIDNKKTNLKVGTWIENLNSFARKEIEIIEKESPDLIISDISAMPFIASKKLNIQSVAISNFIWYDVLTNISSFQKEILKSAYECADYAIQLPLGTEMGIFPNKTKVGFIAKKPTLTRKEIRKKIGVSDSEFCVFVNLNENYNFDWEVEKNVRIISTGARINADNVIKINPWIEGQNLIFGSDLVICKCGYGMISECLTNGIRFQYIMDENHLEQKSISLELEQKKYYNKITVTELNHSELTEDYILTQKQPKKEQNDTSLLVSDLLDRFN